MSLSIFTASNIHPKLLKIALDKTMESVPHDQVYVAANEKIELSKEYQICQLDNTFARDDYNHLVYKQLNNIIATDHVLVIQYDGFATNKNFWTDEFLEYDYIGAPLNALNPCISWDLGDRRKYKWFVGNGGFSLRSKKLLEVLASDPQLTPAVKTTDGSKILCEDIALSFDQRDYLKKEYKIKFAPLKVALRFSMESVKGDIFSLGFHGLQNVPYFLSEDEAKDYIIKYFESQNISPYHVKGFFVSCIDVNYFELAKFVSKSLNQRGINFPKLKL